MPRPTMDLRRKQQNPKTVGDLKKKISLKLLKQPYQSFLHKTGLIFFKLKRSLDNLFCCKYRQILDVVSKIADYFQKIKIHHLPLETTIFQF